MDPHHFGNLDPHLHQIKKPDPHQSDKLDPEPDPHKLADDKPKCMEYKPFLVLFQGFKPLFGS
jgi:hypothetical protein